MSHSAPETKAKLQKQNRTLSMIDWPGVVGKKRRNWLNELKSFLKRGIRDLWRWSREVHWPAIYGQRTS